MNFVQFKNSLRDFPVFSIADIRVALGDFDRRRLSEWQEKGHIIKIVKGYYVFSDVAINEDTLLAIAHKIYRPSYVSLETALSHYRLIPESLYMITSVSTRRTYLFETPVARFSYRAVGPKLFFGYSVLPGGATMASMEKAILDFLYLNPAIQTGDDFVLLRISSSEVLNQLDRGRFAEYVERFGRKSLARRVARFLAWLENA